MSHNIEERKSHELMVKLIHAIDFIEKHQGNDAIKLPEPSIDPQSYFADVPGGFYDEDLAEIQSMNLEAVEVELEIAGYDKESVTKNLKLSANHNVLFLPIENKEPVEITENKVNDFMLSVIFKEALAKSLVLQKEGNKSIDRNKHPLTQTNSQNGFGRKITTLLISLCFPSMCFASVQLVNSAVANSDKVFIDHTASSTTLPLR